MNLEYIRGFLDGASVVCLVAIFLLTIRLYLISYKLNRLMKEKQHANKKM